MLEAHPRVDIRDHDARAAGGDRPRGHRIGRCGIAGRGERARRQHEPLTGGVRRGIEQGIVRQRQRVAALIGIGEIDRGIAAQGAEGRVDVGTVERLSQVQHVHAGGQLPRLPHVEMGAACETHGIPRGRRGLPQGDRPALAPRTPDTSHHRVGRRGAKSDDQPVGLRADGHGFADNGVVLGGRCGADRRRGHQEQRRASTGPQLRAQLCGHPPDPIRILGPNQARQDARRGIRVNSAPWQRPWTQQR